jgi:biopolymer transport protein ExbB/TolQ
MPMTVFVVAGLVIWLLVVLFTLALLRAAARADRAADRQVRDAPAGDREPAPMRRTA